MLPFSAVHLLACLLDVRQSENEILMAEATYKLSTDWGGIQERLRDRLVHLSAACHDLQMPVHLRALTDLLSREASVRNNQLSNTVLVERLRDLQRGILVELSHYRFYYFSGDDARLIDGGATQFGEKVQEVFLDAVQDIAASAQCLALNQWTACVFHCMRVLEHGLKSFAEYLEVPFEEKSWGTVIDGIEKKIKELAEQKRGPAKTAKLQFCSETASQFRYLKDAWRNHSMHAKAFYNSNQAQSVWIHTKAFMESLANKLPGTV